ncbi:MAG: histidine--tRNA ligase, partial [Actinobacteria bacterium]|nr:histidine--tRNA ligase [Actinomycetota bacterium]
RLRTAGYVVEPAYTAGSARAQLRRADALKAKVAVMLGTRELQAGVVALKPLDGRPQTAIARDALLPALAALLRTP